MVFGLMIFSLSLSLSVSVSTGWSIQVRAKARPRLVWICPSRRERAPGRGLKRTCSGPRPAGTSPTGRGPSCRAATTRRNWSPKSPQVSPTGSQGTSAPRSPPLLSVVPGLAFWAVWNSRSDLKCFQIRAPCALFKCQSFPISIQKRVGHLESQRSFSYL